MDEPKKKQLTIELDGEWVLKHRDDDELPIALLKKELSQFDGVEILNSSFTSLTVVYEESAAMGDIQEKIGNLLSAKYPQEYNGNMASFRLEDAPTEEAAEEQDGAKADEQDGAEADESAKTPESAGKRDWNA